MILTHPQELAYSVQTENCAHDWWHQVSSRINENFWSNESNIAAASTDLAFAGRKDISYPLNLRAIGQRKNVEFALPKDVNRRSVPATRLAAHVCEDSEARQPSREQSGERIEHMDCEGT